MINKLLKQLIRNEDGNAAIIFALGLVVFLGFTALVSDIGVLYLQKTRMVNSLDAAVLAGSQELPYDTNKALTIAKNYAAKNGISENDIDLEITSGDKKLTVKSNKEVNLFFAKVLGINKAKVTARSSAQVGALVGVQGAAPLAIEEQQFIYGQAYTLKEGHGSYGWFGPLSLGGGGSSQYEENLTYGYNGKLKVGDIVPTETGNVSGATRKAIDYHIYGDTHNPPCTYDSYVKGCTKILIIPVIKHPSDYNQVKQVEIVGFTAFFVSDVTNNGNDSIITGYFIKYLTPGEIDLNKTGFGLNGVKLVS